MDPESTQQLTNPPAKTLFADSDVQELEKIVEQFRDGNLTKSKAIQSITARLNFDSLGEETKKFAALDQYLSTLDSVKQKRWPDWGLNPGPSKHIPDALTTKLLGLYQQIN